MSNLNSKIYKGYCKELRERIKFLNEEREFSDLVIRFQEAVPKEAAFDLLKEYRKVLRKEDDNYINFVRDTLGRQGGVVAVRDNNGGDIIYLIDYIYEYDDEYDDEKYDISVYGAPDPYKTIDDGEWYVWSKNNFVIDWQETVMAMKEYMIIQKVEDSVDYSV